MRHVAILPTCADTVLYRAPAASDVASMILMSARVVGEGDRGVVGHRADTQAVTEPTEATTRSGDHRDLPGELDHDAVPAISRPDATPLDAVID